MYNLTDIYYEKALRKIEATPPDVQALPGAEDLTLAYVSQKTMEEERDREFAQGLGLAKERLAERTRQAHESLGLRKEVLGEFKKQGRWATGISLANIGLTGLGGYAKLKEAERQENITNLLIKHATEMADLKKKVHMDIIDILKRQKGILTNIQ